MSTEFKLIKLCGGNTAHQANSLSVSYSHRYANELYFNDGPNILALGSRDPV